MTSSTVGKTYRKSSTPLPAINVFSLLRRRKLHNYANQECGVDYIFEVTDPSGTKGYMTAQSGRVKLGDQVLLRQGNTLMQYQVKEIDYYSSPVDMWTGMLTKCS